MRFYTIDPQTGQTSDSHWQWQGGNVLADGASASDGPGGFASVLEPGRKTTMWSGWLGDWDAEAGGMPEFATWTKAGWDQLWAWCESVADGLRASGGEVCLLAHARHVVADPQACLIFLRGAAERGWEGLFGIALEPAAMLTGDMLSRTPEHIERVVEAVSPVSRVASAAGARLDDQGGPLRCALSESQIDADAIIRAVLAAEQDGAELLAWPHTGEADGAALHSALHSAKTATD